MRLCYHRLSHYNSIVDPYAPTIGVGLGLPGHNPGSADRNQVKQAVKNSESDLVEKTMLEDKIRATDWEATNEAIEEQVARESYLQWLRDNEKRHAGRSKSKSATVTSADLAASEEPNATAASSTTSASTTTTTTTSSSQVLSAVLKAQEPTSRSSPKPSCSHSYNDPAAAGVVPSGGPVGAGSPKAGCSSQCDSPKPCCSQQSSSTKAETGSAIDPTPGATSGFVVEETASFLNRLPPNMFGKKNVLNPELDQPNFCSYFQVLKTGAMRMS